MTQELSSKEERALAVAREAWSAAVPTEADTEGAVRRIRPRLRSARRRSFSRQAGKLTVIFIVLGAGLAWASGESSRFALLGDPPVPPLGDTVSVGQGAAARALTQVEPEAPKLSPDVLSEPQGSASAGVKPGARTPTALVNSKVRANSKLDTETRWRAVREALADGDSGSAQRALAELADQKDPNTRIKAELGLAQLAVARGDCKRATAISAAILAKDASKAMRKRAVNIAMQCHDQ